MSLADDARDRLLRLIVAAPSDVTADEVLTLTLAYEKLTAEEDEDDERPIHLLSGTTFLEQAEDPYYGDRGAVSGFTKGWT